ncbi:MAG TPA: sigma factor-like helix-turn-helix DNA-binding protein [Pseudomonadota bacterium]|nr:sigma factor-like helix-turn-helix DNA-binding protein [Pseudomonadota bacterium]
MLKATVILAKLWNRFSTQRTPAIPVPIENADLRKQREQLFVCAMQLLDDAAGAEQVVRQTLSDAHVPQSPETAGWALRQVVGLSVQRLKALSIVPVLPPLPEAARLKSVTEEKHHSGTDPDAQPAQDPRANHDHLRRERLGRALLKLPVEMRVTLILSRMQNRPLAEVAALLGTTETTCQFWLSHGRKLLRRALQRDLGHGTENSSSLQVLVSPETPHDMRGNKKAIARA